MKQKALQYRDSPYVSDIRQLEHRKGVLEAIRYYHDHRRPKMQKQDISHKVIKTFEQMFKGLPV